MKIIYDETEAVVTLEADGRIDTYPLESPEAFQIMSRAWVRASWDAKYSYTFTWLGRPMIQLPEDMIRLQEVIHHDRPDVLIETGVAHGGSLIFYASLFKAMGKGRVIGVELDLRPHNRSAIMAHPLNDMITLVDGSSTEAATLAKIKAALDPQDRIMVVLDSDHSKRHVLDELRAYSSLVSVGCYMVATDGIMGAVAGGPRTQPHWTTDNPTEAALAFVAENPDFAIEEPVWAFNESILSERLTYWPGAYVKRLR